ncbi:NTP transferase domain-containing protein [Ruegeria sp. Ofav3-42]|uniref:nucleotidyltransferase family protein n=1 Tax=Ruegeria sp. Ofav3-42 TaxID=2917759 RepID=UPI001EF64AFF|nr:nucleotidyltransferase family protein [Ruegeria sp. Ofav3-42]MCG7519537.1 nucleotidyltransferase family protein [Ruegeria sp. Ofav3-42]
MIEIPIILLAAGQSRRMAGADKLLQSIEGKSLLRRSALTALKTGPVIVALPPAPHPRYEALAGLDLTKVGIPNADEGMNASLRGALAHTPPEADAVMVLLADLPDITVDDLKSVIASVHEQPDHLIWRGATSAGKPGHPVIFDRQLFDELSRLTGDDGAQSVVRAHKDKVCLVPLPGRNALLDLDTPEDWAQWRSQRTT